MQRDPRRVGRENMVRGQVPQAASGHGAQVRVDLTGGGEEVLLHELVVRIHHRPIDAAAPFGVVRMLPKVTGASKSGSEQGIL